MKQEIQDLKIQIEEYGKNYKEESKFNFNDSE